MEALDVDTPRGAVAPVAKLTLEPPEIEARLGLRFTPVANDLGPAVLALGRLADGTVVAFARLEHERAPGVDVVQFAGRPPRDVLTELLYETGLTHDEVSWVASATAGADDRPWARSYAEAHLYVLLNVQPDDDTPDVVEQTRLIEAGGERSLRYRDVEVWVRRQQLGRPGLGLGVFAYPDEPPSTIIDAGGWWFVAHESAARVRELLQEYGPRPIDADEYVAVSEPLFQAAGAAEEVLRFLPAGADTVPVRAFWTRLGLGILRRQPAMFNRRDLEAAVAEYRSAIAEFRRVYGPPRSTG